MKVFSALLLLVLGSMGQALETTPVNCEPGNPDYLNVNPLGTCFCPGHLWVAENCRAGFYCPEGKPTTAGCYKECDVGEFLLVNVEQGTWACQVNGPLPIDPGFVRASEVNMIMIDANKDSSAAISLKDIARDISLLENAEDKALVRCPVGGFDLCPSVDVAPIPDPEDITGNPMGTCRCNGELWVSEGCSYGFLCDDTKDIGGSIKTCDPGTYLVIDWEQMDWSCSNNAAKCPGGQVSGIGCPKPNCENGAKAECGCEGQFWINDDCTEGFYCTENNDDPYLFDGCVQTCLNGQVLLPDFAQKSWRCVDRDDFSDLFKCPGQFHFECPANDVGSDFDGTECDCDHQIIISADCTEGFYCFESTLLGKGLDLKCPEGQIIDVNTALQTWRCVDDKGQCPGLGGFKLGCEGDNEVPPPTFNCDTAVIKNPLGECTCGGQLFTSDDCTELFYCYAGVSTNGGEGCHLKCTDGQVAFLDIENKNWQCIDPADDFACPGKFNTNCAGTPFAPECGCSGEVWMNDDCTEGFICSEAKSGATNKGDIITCNEGEIIDISLQDPANPKCSSEIHTCPGSFNFGCLGGNIGSGVSFTSSIVLVIMGIICSVRFF